MSHDNPVEEPQSSTAQEVITPPGQKTVKYNIPGAGDRLNHARAQIQADLKKLSDEATFFRDGVKTAKTSTKKQYYQKKLTKSTQSILKLLSTLQAISQ